MRETGGRGAEGGHRGQTRPACCIFLGHMDLPASIRRFFSRLPPLHELTWLILLCAISFGVWGFVSIAEEVTEGDTHEVDEAILMTFRTAGDVSDPIGPGWMEEVLRDITALGGMSVLILITTSVVAYLLLAGRRRTALLILGAVASGVVLAFTLKSGYARPRPDLVPHSTRVYTNSFPSAHSMISAVTYLTLGSLLAWQHKYLRVKVFAFTTAVVLTVLVGVSRVYLGVHWPTDVLAGWSAGFAWALAWWLLARRLEARGTVDPQAEDAQAKPPKVAPEPQATSTG